MSACYLDIHIEIDNGGRLNIKLNDKRDDVTFTTVNFLFVSSNIPASPAYGVYTSPIISYSRDCAEYSNLQDREQLDNDLKSIYLENNDN